VGSAVANQDTWIPICFAWKTSQLERKNHGPKPTKSLFFPLLSKRNSTSSSSKSALEDLRHQDTSKSLMPTTRFAAQKLGIGAISTKMAEQQFKGDNNADLVFTTLWARPDA
jgi:hypothetical protein